MKTLVTFEWDPEVRNYSAYIASVPVCGEGASKEEALQSLKEGLDLYIEEEGRDALLSHLGGKVEYQEIEFAQLV